MSPSPGKAQVRVAGPSLASPPYGPPRRLLSRGESAGHSSGGSGVPTSCEGETENSPGAIFLCDLLSRVFPLGMERKHFPE